MKQDIFNAYLKDGWHIFKLIKTKDGDGNAVKGLYKTPKGWNDTEKTYEYNSGWIYGGVPPSDMVVIDWDVKGGKKQGDKSFERLQSDLGITLETQVKTPSGGGHCYVRLKNLPEDTPKLKKAQELYPDIDFQSHGSEFVVLGGQTVSGYGDYLFTDEDFEYYVNPPTDFSTLELRRERVQGEGYDSVDAFEHTVVRPPIDEVKQMLSNISPDSGHDDGWQQVAMCLNSWDLNGEEGEKLFVEWSLSSKKYVEAEGVDAVRQSAERKYANCVADTPDYYKKLFTLSNKGVEKGLDELLDDALDISDLEDIADTISSSRISNTKRDVYIEKLSAKCKELTGKREKVKWKNAVVFVDKAKAEERQDAAEKSGLPDYVKTKTGVKYLSTLGNLKYFIENISSHSFKYDVILKRVIVDDNYSIIVGEGSIMYSKLMDELVKHDLVGSTIMAQHFEAATLSNAQNPLLEYVESFPQWDGERDYISEVAETLHCEVASAEYKREVMQCFAIQAIAAWDGKLRTVNKLSRLDSVLTFVGSQGVGKTTWVANLMPEFMSYYFKDGLELNPSDKDSYIQATQAGLVELGELDATNRKSDISSLKAFLSSEVDSFRAPYGRTTERYKRQTVYVGTVNNKDFLKDATGSRRFLVLDVKSLDLPSKEVIEGMWSQALVLYLQGLDWRLPSGHSEFRDILNKGFTDFGIAGDIASELKELSRSANGSKIRVSLTKLIEGLGVKMNSRERSDFISCLDNQGFARYSDGKYYLPSDIFTLYKLSSKSDGFEDLDEL